MRIGPNIRTERTPTNHLSVHSLLSSLLSSMQQEQPNGKFMTNALIPTLPSSMQQEQLCKQRTDCTSKRLLLPFMQQEQPNGKFMTNALIPTLLSSMQQERRAGFAMRHTVSFLLSIRQELP